MPTFLSDQQVTELRTAHKAVRDKRIADKIKAVLMLHHGYTYDQIHEALLLDEVTVRRHVKEYERHGVDGLLECRYTGGVSELTVDQQAQLKRFLKKNMQRTAIEIRDHIHTVYHITYSVIGVTKLLHRLGFSYKKPKIVPGKADTKKQARFLAAYRKLKAEMGESDHLYFADATHPQHNTRPSYGWILKGKQNDKFVQTTSGRKRLNLHGALSFNDHTAIVLSEETINAQSVMRLGTALLKKHSTGKIYFVVDNAKYYHAMIVKAWRKKHCRIKFIFLPSYSPNLNLIERLWRFFHQKVTWNRYFESFEEFKSVSLGFFKNLKQYDKELATLLADNFQVLSAKKLQT